MTKAGSSRTSARGRRPGATRPPVRRGGSGPARPHRPPRARSPHSARRTPADRRAPRRSRRRVVAMLVVLVVAFAAVAVRLVQVQALSGDAYAAFGASQRFQDVTLPADRGSIFDRHGNDLAASRPAATIWANPSLIEHPLEVATALATPLGLDPTATEALANRLAGENQFTYVARRVDDEVAAAVRSLDLPGVAFVDEPQRFNPAGDLGRSVLGQVGVDNDGLSGLELQYDEALTGDAGELIIEKDPDGRTIPGGEHERQPAERGDDLVLTIDRSMQYETERALAAQIAAKGAKGGTAIVSRPSTGEILALANFTTDPETGALQATGNNVAATGVYEPGSVNKVITVAAALEEGLVAPDTMLTVPDSLQVSDHLFSDHDPHPTEELLGDPHPVGVVEHRDDQAGPDAGRGAGRHLPAPLRLRHQDRSRLPERDARPAPARRRLQRHVHRLHPHRSGHRGHRRADAAGLQRAGQRRRLRAAQARAGDHRQRGGAPPDPDQRALPGRVRAHRRADAGHAGQRGQGGDREPGRHHGLHRGGQDGDGPQAPRHRGLPGRVGLPLRRQLRRLRAGGGPRALDHRGDRRALRGHLRWHGGGAGVRGPRPVRPAPLPHPAAPGGAGAGAGHRGGRPGGGGGPP